MDRRALTYFLAVADHGSFTAAATALRIAQPSLSQAVQSLERDLGVGLFHRRNRGVQLTVAGEALVAPARRTLRDFDDARAAVQNVSGLRRGRLDIVARPHLALDPLPRLLESFHRRYPDVTIRILDAQSSSSDVMDMLRSGDAEIALDFDRPQRADLSAVQLADSEIVLVLPPGSENNGPVPQSFIEEVGLIAGIEGTQRLMQKFLSELGVTPRIVVESEHRLATIPLVLAGLGGALLPAGFAQRAQAVHAVTCRFDPPLMRQVFLIHPSSPRSPAGQAFLDLVVELEP